MSSKLYAPRMRKPAQSTNARLFSEDNTPQMNTEAERGEPLHGEVLRLQRLIGNQQAIQLLRGGGVADVVQREGEGTLEMPPLQVGGDSGGTVEGVVPNLDRLTGVGVDPSEPQMGRDDETVTRNAPEPTERLPYTPGGWDGNTILTRLGQYDRLSGTDSDTTRCVQAVAMASHIPAGPQAVAQYLGDIGFDAAFVDQYGQQRQQTAMQVIRLVRGRLTARTATYGDLSWAQEAIHDVFYNDVSGTPEEQIVQQISPTLDMMSRDTTPVNIWCNTPAEVMAQAATLPAGGQLIVNSWVVVFNSAFDQVEEQGYQTRDRMRVEINGRMQWIRRIATDTRPSPQDIHFPSDSKSGHQLLILKDNDTQGTLRLYEPEVTDSGQHLQVLSASGAELQSYLHDNSDMGIYGYIQITGKIIPRAATTSAFAAP